ncbi:MAG: FHA domain-containing protein [Myxococcota bacterium]
MTEAVGEEAFGNDARRLGRTRFLEKYRGLYLVKRPLADTIARGNAEGARRGFDTEQFSRETLLSLQDSADVRADLLGGWAARWLVLPIRKRTDLFPDRISIGRTNTSDIIIPFGFISKLQAHIYIDDQGRIDLIDRSTNGMQLDRRQVEPGTRVRLYIGCRLEIGPLELDLLDALSLYQLLA